MQTNLTLEQLRNLDFSKAIVKCDTENNTQDIINNGMVRVDIIVPPENISFQMFLEGNDRKR